MNKIKYTSAANQAKYKELYSVESESNPAKSYVVALNRKGGWECSCPAWTRHTPRKNCKHINRLVAFLDRVTTATAGRLAEMVVMPEIQPTAAQQALIDRMSKASLIEL